MTPEFPADFLWGVATSSHQIEGAAHADGRTESIWDRFAATPGKIADGSNASVACDHYHLWRDDIERLKWLGVKSYRFSIAWSRVLPEGTGRVNEKGLDFYEDLIDGLLDAGIEPYVTLYHWDLPQVLQDRGGWVNRDVCSAFVEYAGAVADRVGDRVRYWATHNEPWCVATLGYELGEHAPGLRRPADSLRAAHHVMLSHGMAVPEIRRRSPGSEVGIVLNLVPAYPHSDSAADRDAARWLDGFFNRWYLDPIFRGEYPEDVIADRVSLGHLESEVLPFVRDGDLDIISGPIDCLGVNYYSRTVAKAIASGAPKAVRVAPEEELTDMGWEVYPRGLEDLLVRVSDEYDPPKLYIAENGAAYAVGPDETGRVPDSRRVRFLAEHLEACARAVARGATLNGYFVWSLLDNFEWAHGFSKRFGLFFVDFETQRRIPKDSAHWYRGVVGSNQIQDAATLLPQEDLA